MLNVSHEQILRIPFFVLRKRPSQVFYKKSVLKNLAKFRGNTYVEGLRHKCFSLGFDECSRNRFFAEHYLTIASITHQQPNSCLELYIKIPH